MLQLSYQPLSMTPRSPTLSTLSWIPSVHFSSVNLCGSPDSLSSTSDSPQTGLLVYNHRQSSELYPCLFPSDFPLLYPRSSGLDPCLSSSSRLPFIISLILRISSFTIDSLPTSTFDHQAPGTLSDMYPGHTTSGTSWNPGHSHVILDPQDPGLYLSLQTSFRSPFCPSWTFIDFHLIYGQFLLIYLSLIL